MRSAARLGRVEVAVHLGTHGEARVVADLRLQCVFVQQFQILLRLARRVRAWKQIIVNAVGEENVLLVLLDDEVGAEGVATIVWLPFAICASAASVSSVSSVSTSHPLSLWRWEFNSTALPTTPAAAAHIPGAPLSQ